MSDDTEDKAPTTAERAESLRHAAKAPHLTADERAAFLHYAQSLEVCAPAQSLPLSESDVHGIPGIECHADARDIAVQTFAPAPAYAPPREWCEKCERWAARVKALEARIDRACIDLRGDVPSEIDRLIKVVEERDTAIVALRSQLRALAGTGGA